MVLIFWKSMYIYNHRNLLEYAFTSRLSLRILASMYKQWYIVLVGILLSSNLLLSRIALGNNSLTFDRQVITIFVDNHISPLLSFPKGFFFLFYSNYQEGKWKGMNNVIGSACWLGKETSKKIIIEKKKWVVLESSFDKTKFLTCGSLLWFNNILFYL